MAISGLIQTPSRTVRAPLVDHISPINDHGGALHERCLGATEEKDTVRDFLSSPRTIHGSDGYRRPKHVHIGRRHWGLNDTGADTIDPDVVLGVLRNAVISDKGVSSHTGKLASLHTSIASHLVMLITAAFEPQ